MITGPLIWEGQIAWWIALGLGGAAWFGMYKLFCGPLRIVAVLGRWMLNAVVWTIALGTGTVVVASLLYMVYAIAQQGD